MCKKNRGIEINKQDFLSGRIINLIKETQKNIAIARKENMNQLSKYEGWLQTSKPYEKIVYHQGYLAVDRYRDLEVGKIASLFLKSASHKSVVIYQKKLSHGTSNSYPVFQYIAQKI